MSKEEILELFDELAARLEGPAEQVFEMAVRHEIVVGVVMLAIVVVAWLVLGGIFYQALRIPHHDCGREAEYSRYCGTCSDQEGWFVLAMGSLIVVAIFTAAMAVPVVERLITPEWIALRVLVPGL